MSDPSREPLDYHNPPRVSRGSEAAGVGCMVLAVLFAGGVLLLEVLVVGSAIQDRSFGQALLCVVVPVALVVVMVKTRDRIRGLVHVAGAIVLIALATFLLLFGVCSANIKF